MLIFVSLDPSFTPITIYPIPPLNDLICFFPLHISQHVVLSCTFFPLITRQPFFCLGHREIWASFASHRVPRSVWCLGFLDFRRLNLYWHRGIKSGRGASGLDVHYLYWAYQISLSLSLSLPVYLSVSL